MNTTLSDKTGLLLEPIYREHRTTPGHPERPERLDAIEGRLRETGMLEQVERIAAQPVDQDYLHLVHTPEYVRRVRRAADRGAGYLDSPDTPVCEASFSVALHAVGGVLAAVDAVMSGKLRNAFCAVRPPGHHALPDRAMGFCLFNNVAVAVRYLQQRYGLARVLVVDWDVHHGNGTQAIFYDDPDVLFFSVHQYPFYPGTGSWRETGWGRGQGATINVPLPAGTSEAEWLESFYRYLLPKATEFRPQFVLVSAGFDAHQDDLLGRMEVREAGFAAATQLVKKIADDYCGGKLVSVLEGGYHLNALGRSVEAHLRALMDHELADSHAIRPPL